jgi:hypothetical protein
VLSAPLDAEGDVYEARPLGFPPNWGDIRRGLQGFDFREDGKFSYLTFLPNDVPVEVTGSWKLEPDSGHIDIELRDIGDAYIPQGASLSRGENGTSANFALEIVTLDDEILQFKVLEELIEDDAHVE